MSAISSNHARIPTEGDTDDGVILVNGEPVREVDGGGVKDDGYVRGQTSIENSRATVTVGYGTTGIRGVEIDWEAGLQAQLEESDPQPEDRYRYELTEMGFDVTVEIVPETELE